MTKAIKGANLITHCIFIAGATFVSASFADKFNPPKVSPGTGTVRPGAPSGRVHVPTAPVRGSVQNPQGRGKGVGDDLTTSGKGATDTALRAEGLPQTTIVSGLAGVLSEADAKELHSKMVSADLDGDQMQAVVDLLKQKGTQQKVSLDEALKEVSGVKGQELGKTEAQRLKEIREAIDADPEIKAEVDAAAKDSAGIAAGFSKLIDSTFAKLSDAQKADPDVLAKVEAAKALVAKAGDSPEAARAAREAVEELVALKNPKYSGVCGPCGCK